MASYDAPNQRNKGVKIIAGTKDWESHCHWLSARGHELGKLHLQELFTTGDFVVGEMNVKT
jgi:hypothetical protein